MTLDSDAHKTNEFQHRRRLRLQQVREQSKDIAKKIRHRANVEKIRHVLNGKSNKEKEFFECQEKFVKRLEQLYSERLGNIGCAHKNVLEDEQGGVIEKPDLSKLRGKEAVIELKRRKQEKLDEQKKVLDRKLKAREAANELSREKSTNFVKSIPKQLTTVSPVDENKNTLNEVVSEQINAIVNEGEDPKRNDMGTQWDSEEVPLNIPVNTLELSENNVNDNTNKIDKTKKPNLFALSEEMFLNLNDGVSNVDVPTLKPSVTLISEYLQNRTLRLRQHEPSVKKKLDEDLQTIKETILRSRATKTDGNRDKSNKMSATDNSLIKKSSVTVYNHNTKDTKYMPCGDSQLVSREEKTDFDAYAQAFKETTNKEQNERDKLNKQQQIRNKIAIQKQNVDKEYKETLSFLSSLPKEMNAIPATKKAYIDEEQQRIQRDRHQQKLQEAFRKVEKDAAASCRHGCKHSKRKDLTTVRNKSRSPSNKDTDVGDKSFQYSWMPVPESDGSLAIHTVPNTTREKENSVKFSQVNCYHEYRSRHKHTPPTKDVEDRAKTRTVLVEDNNDTDETATSDTSSVDNLNLDRRTDEDTLMNAERIIIYKILNSKNYKKANEKEKIESKKRKGIIKSTTHDLASNETGEKAGINVTTQVSQFQDLEEGIYKATDTGDNIEKTYIRDNVQGDSNIPVKADDKDKETGCRCGGFNKSQDSRNVGGETQLASSKTCSCCKRSLDPPSATSSSCSFNTAINRKLCPSDNDFLKLIDETGEGRNKFYIGASGILKDNNYEVIIQLRKKESELDNKVAKDLQPTLVSSQPVEKEEPRPKSPGSLRGDVISKELETSQRDEVPQTEEKQSLKTLSSKIVLPTNSNEETNIELIEKASVDKIDICDKGVVTSFHDSFAIPFQADPISKPSKSIYTQTSFSSPTARPAFMHSSSTSTAYMSPPDVIRPRALRRDSVITSDDIYDSSNSVNGRRQQTSSKGRDCKHDADKHRHVHSHVKRGSKSCNFNKKSPNKQVPATPPNTCRNYDKFNYSTDLESFKNAKSSKCRKCVSRSEMKIDSKRCLHRKRRASNTKSVNSLSATSVNKGKQNTSTSKRMENTKLDPVVKNYVNKLLSLNKEGLKAIEVIKQDCSAVTTPSNSIINVTSNVDEGKSYVDNKISLEQLKNIVQSELVGTTLNDRPNTNRKTLKNTNGRQKTVLVTKKSSRTKRPAHKVKSLNISKKIMKKQCTLGNNKEVFVSSTKKQLSNEDYSYESTNSYNRVRNRSSPITKKDTVQRYNKTNTAQKFNQQNDENDPTKNKKKVELDCCKKSYAAVDRRLSRRSVSSDSETFEKMTNYLSSKESFSICTRTKGVIENDNYYMKIAEDKLQNMEKIADLTDKCTKRLSNLAKVLDEVRRNKSLVYSQISSNETSSASVNRSDMSTHNDPVLSSFSTKVITSANTDESIKSPVLVSGKHSHSKDVVPFPQLLKDIPKPIIDISKSIVNDTDKLNGRLLTNNESSSIKCRAKPPPALTRHIKPGQDILVTPHELSTVVEVDSPISIKLKNKSSCYDNNFHKQENTKSNPELSNKKESHADLDIVANKNSLTNTKTKISMKSPSVESKLQMMDMNQFNDIMLKPYISVQEYAKQYKIALDDGSNIEDALKEGAFNDEMTSLHSESSLPDVMAELLKRKIITEPFKFDTGSNNNTSSLSSESTLSMLALSRARKMKNFKENSSKHRGSAIETSESVSISSNPDLENAFQKLGMGWASSTLKKTKERLALTSSSSTSSSSLRKFRIKSFNQDLPDLATDSISSLTSIKDDSKNVSEKKGKECIKSAIQQTSITNSMTVKQFLHNELANKITFNRSNSKVAEEFVSLYETKMPEEIKNSKVVNIEEISNSSVNSANNNRARTSTPVQIFKSTTYHTSSSSNTSNGLFSNVDDLSSVKHTSNSLRNHSTSDKEDLTIPNYSLKFKKSSDLSKSE